MGAVGESGGPPPEQSDIPLEADVTAIRGTGLRAPLAEIRAESIDEMKHADQLMARIRYLGASPDGPMGRSPPG